MYILAVAQRFDNYMRRVFLRDMDIFQNYNRGLSGVSGDIAVQPEKQAKEIPCFADGVRGGLFPQPFPEKEFPGGGNFFFSFSLYQARQRTHPLGV